MKAKTARAFARYLRVVARHYQTRKLAHLEGNNARYEADQIRRKLVWIASQNGD